MDRDTRKIVLQMARGDGESKDALATVTFCEYSASLTIGDLTIHLPWSELAQWQVWLADRVEAEGD